jgi:hypothetical protein
MIINGYIHLTLASAKCWQEVMWLAALIGNRTIAKHNKTGTVSGTEND